MFFTNHDVFQKIWLMSHKLIATSLTDDGPDFTNLQKTVVLWLNAGLIPILVIIGGLSVYKLAMLGWRIAHTADSPDERRQAIHGLCWWGVGLVLCIAAPVIVNVLVPQLINSSGHYNPDNS